MQPYSDPTPDEAAFRRFDGTSPDHVRDFYRLSHSLQTREFVRSKKLQYGAKRQGERSIWEAMEYLNTLVDDSDPDTDLSQIEHNLQTAEALRREGHPPWLVLAGLIHDLGKVLCLYGEPQWAVVGDTFPVGCAYSNKVVFPEFFAGNPDSLRHDYQTRLGVYEEKCGLDRVDLSWGHDEYMYQVVKDYLPEQALYMIRYHSFYAWHHDGEYVYLMDDKDVAMLPHVQKFSAYDLYSKSDERPDVLELRPYYEDLIAQYFPEKIAW
jgi:inositol oxygenase